MKRKFEGKSVAPAAGSTRVKVLGTRPAENGRTEIFFMARWKKDEKLFPVLREMLDHVLGSPCTFLNNRGKKEYSMTIMWSREIWLRKGGMWNYVNIQQQRFNEALSSASDNLLEQHPPELDEMDYYFALDEQLKATT